MLTIYILITRFLNFHLMPILKIGFFTIQYLRFIFFIDFNHSCIETVKINESRNNECTYLRFDSPNRKLGPESNNRLGCKMAKFSDMLPGKR